ncbi:AAA family ATPase [Planotetraspora sp. A-T 1434]|uniref:adenylate/guanylate cyclase domain-containing protein n=1 Tax=Planotetraspora sp. A-T 1434 TaxID=2979219 RepID=UPI0021BF978C|nr:adenylate/guanylate cyclase domain-containing protein [Planotetraspora sp. A-T 1434]MCT9933596.1 AAA family ATPase [Planotetraspora sp. A-T 1434]
MDVAGTRVIRKVVSVIFCDLTESTALSGELDPESLRSILLRYFDLMRDRVEYHGGVVEKFIGDAVVGVFGVPTLHEDDALRAVRAALEMRAALESFNDEVEAEIGIRLRARIGVNTGEVVASAENAGSQALVSGQVVNVAARLQTAAAPGEIVIGHDTRVAAGQAVVAAPTGPLSLRGVDHPVVAWRVESVRADDPAVSRRFDLPFVNRHSDFDSLDAHLDAVTARRHCRVVTVLGEAGIGKTRLVRTWAGRSPVARRARLASGRCRPYGEGGSLLSLAEALRPLARKTEAEPEIAAVLAAGLLADGTPGTGLEETVWAVGGLLRAVSGDRPVVLILDDMQWAAPALTDALTLLESQVRDLPLLVLCVARPEPRGHRAPGVLHRVERLTDDDSRVLACELADLSRPSQTPEVSAHAAGAVMTDQVVSRAEGNPLFLEQLMTMLGHGEEPERLPLSLRALIAARVESLPEDERAVLECGAVAGREFTLAQIGVLGISGEPGAPGDAVGSLVRGRFLEPVDGAEAGRLRFVSGLIQEVCYQAVSKRRLSDLHERLAGWSSGHGEDDEVVGRHLEQAYRHRAGLGRPDERSARLRDRAAAHLSAAGASALRRGDLNWASGLLERAVGLYDADDPLRLPTAERLAETWVMLGQVDRGERLLREVADDASAAVATTWAAAGVAAHARLFLGHLDPEPSARTAHDCLPVFEAAGDHLGLARAWIRIGQAAQARGRLVEAAETLDRALGHAVRADAELERATALGALSVSLWLGPVAVEAAVEQCLGLLREHGEGRRTVAAVMQCPLAVMHAMRGDTAQARAAFLAAEAIMTGIGHAFAGAFLPLFSASLDLLAGRPEAAETALRRSCTAAESLGDGQLLTTAWRDLARARLDQGDPDGARGWIGLALSSASGSTPINRAELLGMKARTVAGDQPSRARLLAARAVREAARTDSPACQATVLLDQAYVLTALSERTAAGDAARQAGTRFAAKGHRVGADRAAALLSVLAAT